MSKMKRKTIRNFILKAVHFDAETKENIMTGIASNFASDVSRLLTKSTLPRFNEKLQTYDRLSGSVMYISKA